MSSGTLSVASALQMQNFDKGLRSRSMGDQLAAIVNSSSLLHDNPFPLFANQLILRLAETFRDGSNLLRIHVSRILSDCDGYLKLVFSGQEVLRRILVVSHSTDPEARAVTLEALASLASIFPENKQIHDLIVESLSTENDFEFKCACNAMIAFAKRSPDFSSTMIGRVTSLLLSTDTTIERKIMIVSVFGQMKSTVTTTQEFFGLANLILETSNHTEFVCSLLSSMTCLAEATRYKIGEQVTVLLNMGCMADDNKLIGRCSLINLRRLAGHSHAWTEEHFKELLALRMNFMDTVNFGCYLSVLIVLSIKPRSPQRKIFIDLVEELTCLSVSESIDHRTSFLRIGCNLLSSGNSNGLASFLANTFIASVSMTMSEKQARKFFSTLGQFLSICPDSQESSALLSTLVRLPSDFPHLRFVIDLFCRLVDSVPAMNLPIHQWITKANIYQDGALNESIAFLRYPPSISVSATTNVISSGTDADKYAVARVALRNGHWEKIAVPNLAAINIDRLSPEFCLWIRFLREVASCELRNFSVHDLQNQILHLQEASSLGKMISLRTTGSTFHFANSLVKCLLSSAMNVSDLVSGLSTFLHMPQQFAMRGTPARIRTLLTVCQSSFQKSSNEWSLLYRSSYCADERTLDYLSLNQSMYSIIHHGISCLVGTSNGSVIPVPTLTVASTSSVQFLELLKWANGEVSCMKNGTVSEQSVGRFIAVVKSLSCHCIGLPRYFFQQTKTLDVKLAVSGVANGELTVVPNSHIPIEIDGVISGYGSLPVTESVTIDAKVTYFTAQGNNYVVSKSVSPKEGGYFAVHFLMQFKQSCQVEFSMDFVDTEKRKLWSANTCTVLSIKVNE